MIKRAILILTAVVLATAAPLRAWCEADCLAPAPSDSTTPSSHCKTTEPDTGTTSMSALVIEDCPTAESARPIAVAKPIAAPAVVPSHPSTSAPAHLRTVAPAPPRIHAPLHLTPTPLRV